MSIYNYHDTILLMCKGAQDGDIDAWPQGQHSGGDLGCLYYKYISYIENIIVFIICE